MPQLLCIGSQAVQIGQKPGWAQNFFQIRQIWFEAVVSGPIAVAHTAGAMSLLWTVLWADNGMAHTQEFACPTTPSTLTSPPPLSVPLR